MHLTTSPMDSLSFHNHVTARLFHIMLKNYLLCYSPMLLNVAYYAIDSYHFTKKSNEIHHTTQNSCFKVHSSSSQAIQYNCTTDYQGCNTVSTVRESDPPPCTIATSTTTTRKVTDISTSSHYLFSTWFGHKGHD